MRLSFFAGIGTNFRFVNDSKETKQSGFRRIVPGALVLVGALAGVTAVMSKGGDQNGAFEGHVVTRSDMRIAVEAEGALEPIRKYVTDNQYRYTTKVISALAEGVTVKKGDIVVELDCTYVSDKLERQELDVTQSKNLLDQARETLSIEESLAEGRLRAAKLAKEFAETDLRQYVDGTWPQQKRNFELDIQQVEEELLLSKEQLDWTIKLEAKGFETRRALALQKLKVTQLETSFASAKEKLRIAETYTYPKLKRKYESSLREAQLDLERETAKSAARLAKYRGNLKTREYVHDNEVDRLNWYKDQVAAAKIRAKADGMVVFPMTRYSSSRGMIEEGSTVYNGQSLISIPDTSEMKVTFMVHESDIHRLKEDQTVRFTLDSYKGEVFTASLTKIAHTPDSMTQYYRPGMKVYKTEAIVESELPEDVRPGMSGSISIDIAQLENVVTVPLKAVTSINGERICMVMSDGEEEIRKVTTGLYNDRNIQILTGLKEGELVSLSPPLGEGAQEPQAGLQETASKHFSEREYSQSLDPIEEELFQLNSGGG